MALPSEHITIKRRRDEEPVEALYLQHKRYKPDVRWDRVTNSQASDVPLFLPSVSSEFKNAVHDLPGEPQVPKIRTTSPEEDLLSRHASSFEAIQRPSARTKRQPRTSNGPTASIITSPRKPGQKYPDVSGPSTGPRRFHFIKHSSFVSSHIVDPAKRVQKNRKGRRGDLPVFIENTKYTSQRRSSRETLARIGDEIAKDYVDSSPAAQDLQQRPRKRPIVSAAEQKWRAENWTKSAKADRDIKGKAKTAQSIDEPSSQWDYNSEVLAGQLQQVAFHEINPATADLKNNRTAPQPKVQPKPPQPRQSTIQQHVDAPSEDWSIVDTSDDGKDENYVYDTYVRSIEQPAGASVISSEKTLSAIEIIDHSKIGVLIIAEEDQEEWETFAEVDQESDRDWNSEEEDENAEDFYGNDYPEDEVKSDDEFDRGAYKYRTGPSDEEEFDHDVDCWSDEDEARHPWKRNVGLIRPEGDHDGDHDMDT